MRIWQYSASVIISYCVCWLSNKTSLSGIQLLERHTTVQNEARWTQSKVGLHLSRAAFYAAIFLTAIGALRLWQLLTKGRKRWNAWIPHQLAVYPRLELLWALIFIPIFGMSSSGIFKISLSCVSANSPDMDHEFMSINYKHSIFSLLLCNYQSAGVSGGRVNFLLTWGLWCCGAGLQPGNDSGT